MEIALMSSENMHIGLLKTLKITHYKENNDKNMEQVNQKIEVSKEIEIKEYKGVMLSENKQHRNKENIKHMEMKTKKMRQIHQRKLIKTREELEMMNNGLINVLNILSIEHREIGNFKNNQRSLIELFKGTCLLYTSRSLTKTN